jgi:hypothetical protein
MIKFLLSILFVFTLLNCEPPYYVIVDSISNLASDTLNIVKIDTFKYNGDQMYKVWLK